VAVLALLNGEIQQAGKRTVPCLTAGLFCQVSLQLLSPLSTSNSGLSFGLESFCFCPLGLNTLILKPLLPVSFTRFGNKTFMLNLPLLVALLGAT
jgi:hypothetical protein